MKKVIDLLKSLNFDGTDLTNRIIVSTEALNEFTDMGGNGLITVLEFPPRQVRKTHTHDELRLTFVRSGKMKFTSENETMKLKAGDFIITLPHTPHSLEVIGKKPLRIVELVIPLFDKDRQKNNFLWKGI